LLKIQVAQKKIKIAFENVDSSSRLELIPSKIKRSKQPFILEESPVDMMANKRTMAELLRAPTEGVSPPVATLSQNFGIISKDTFQQPQLITVRGRDLSLTTPLLTRKGELKSITTRSGLVLDGPTVPTPPLFINSKEDERVEETLTDPDLSEYTIKVPPRPVQKYKPLYQRDYVVHQRDPLHPNIPYPSRMLQQKQQEKDEVQI
nr:hypothetical protein [Tanacetum cinerariifolium]